ncbi:RidA family protein [Rhodoblastus acidophilus]|uniref:RidA family protein n=1 Tax=Candidatus Rhodoblastus alkanivorans TaxID=2954117 RepID=A0ABS9Z792_9HYPH|nr:RidA family protein [Candidatus Rhodoblastus alkanivorans]MCI4678391.1 RidA family protein [Candidatus Rhodoblastus alkanivorans]MCI4682936.1 RidA family protein [Candidatus Rhodoblastus alkanivorans]MDI4640246.1 RidA family protein [Rhodoblastus acidophilus]
MGQTGSDIEQRLRDLGHVLPQPTAPLANYVPTVASGALLFVSGQLPFGADGKLASAYVGRVGGGVSEVDAAGAAALSALNCLAQAKTALGDLGRIQRCIRLGGFINAVESFTGLAGVMNGASDLIGEALGAAGAHARSTIGVAQLPLGACVEVEAIFEIAS